MTCCQYILNRLVGINIENVTVDADVTDAGVWNDILSVLNNFAQNVFFLWTHSTHFMMMD
jgi:hypothetical protein